MEAPDTAKEPMELPFSEKWKSGSDEVRRVSNSPAPRSHSPSRKHNKRYSYSSLSRVPFTSAAIRKTSYSPQSDPLTGNTDVGSRIVVGNSHRPVKSQFAPWGTSQVASGATREGESVRLITVSEGVSIMREQGDKKNPSFVVSSPAIKFVAGNQHEGQASAGVKPTRRPDAREDTTTVSKSIAQKPFKKTSRGGVRYVMIKTPRRLNGVTYPPRFPHKGQGWYSSNLVSSSQNAQHGKVNSPVESKHVRVTQSNSGKFKSVLSRGGHGAGKPNTWTQIDPAKSSYRPYKAVQVSSSLTGQHPSGPVPLRKNTTPAGYQEHSKNVGPQMAARPEGLFERHRSTGDVRKTMRVTSSRNFTVPSSTVGVWPQREVALTANVKPTVNPVPAKVFEQATSMSEVDVSHGDVSKPHKKPDMLQSLNNSWPQSPPVHSERIMPTKIITYGSVYSSSGVLGSPTNRPNLVSSTGVLGSYGVIQASNNQYSKPPTASGGKSQSMDTKFQPSQTADKKSEPKPQMNPTHSSSNNNNYNNNNAKPGLNANVKISTVALSSGLNHIPLTSTDFPKSEHTSTQHQPTESQAQSQPSPETNTGHNSGRLSVGKGVLEGTKNSRRPESHSSMILEQRYQNIKASNAALRGSPSRGHVGKIQSSGQRGKSLKSGALTAMITGNADFSPHFGRKTTVNSQRGGHIMSQGVRKVTGIHTRFGYIEVPMAVMTFSSSIDGRSVGRSSSDATLTPAVLKKVSRMTRLTQTQSSTSTHVIGTRVNSSSSSKKGKTRRKFKPVGLANIGSSVAFKSKRIRSVSGSIGNAALRDPGNIVTLQSTSQSTVQQMTTSGTTTAEESSLIHQKPHQARSGSEDNGGSQVEGNQTTVKPANLEEDGELVDGLPTNSSMAPSAAIHGKDGAEFDEGVLLDPSATNLTQSTESTSSFVAFRHMHVPKGKPFIRPFSTPEALQQGMAITQLKPLNISDVKLSAVKSMSGPLSDDGINHVQTVFHSTETVQDEAVAGFHLETKNVTSNSPEIGA